MYLTGLIYNKPEHRMTHNSYSLMAVSLKLIRTALTSRLRHNKPLEKVAVENQRKYTWLLTAVGYLSISNCREVKLMMSVMVNLWLSRHLILKLSLPTKATAVKLYGSY
ncbi:hypothetical protein BFC18_19040 [Alteromonas confluentis]|uniref:Uncharacterized protein n=1 Tax=Alteromonas confluentis TaxID=1656094 RepID=A0A1E7Z610_9ALTE|nr:hypothetical protein BFC18_19040 [Alteromonas confluentis]